MNSLHDGDDALAELELLAQNQKKLNQLTVRMTHILSGFDKRLASLESTLLPIHHRTQALQRVEKNVDSTLEALKHTLGHFDVVDEEEPRIRQGPDSGDLGPYMESIDRVLRGLEYTKRSDLKSQEGLMMRMHELIEEGARNLIEVLRQWVASESNAIDVADYTPQRLVLPMLSGETLEAIIPVLSYLKSLPTNPTNSYAPFLAALANYSDTRGAYLEASLASMSQRLIAFATERIGTHNQRPGGIAAAFAADDDEGAYHRGSAGVKEWVKAVLDMAENEHAILSNLLRSLSPPSSTSTIASTFSRLLRPLLRHFSTTMSSLHTLIKRRLSTHTLFAFDLVSVLTDLSPRWGTVIIDSCGKTTDDGSVSQVLNEQLQHFRGTLMNVFPSFLIDIKALARQREGEVPSTNINEITYSGLSFIRQMIEYGEIVLPLLSTLGAGSWKMSGANAPALSHDAANAHTNVLSHYLCDTLSTIISALDDRSRAIKQISTASIFMLNNLGHLQHQLTSGDVLTDYFGAAGTSIFTSSMRSARAGYLDLWNPVVSTLLEDDIHSLSAPNAPTGKAAKLAGVGSKDDVRTRMTAFNDRLEDIERLHVAYPIGRDDEELRESVSKEVLRLILPLYSRFGKRHMATGHSSSSVAKYVRPEGEVEDRIIRIFS